MNKFSVIFIFFLLFGCSPKIHEHFEQNHFIKNYTVHVINDSLQFYFTSPVDINYTTKKEELKKIIRHANIKIKDSVLIYGKTSEPAYEFFVTVAKNHKQVYPKNVLVFDTVVYNTTIQFIGHPLAKNSIHTLEKDLKKIFESLEIGEGYRKEKSTVMDVVQKYQSSNKYFAALNEIKEFPTYGQQEDWSKLQMALTFSSFLGKNEMYEAYLKKLESRFKPNDTIAEIIREHSVVNLAVLDTIIRAAKTHQIVMINENHFYPNHRLLVSDLLEKLKEIGYNYFALEALSMNQDSLLNLANAYPSLETGFYTREQNYANLIRKAKKLGFEFIAYENVGSNKDRETGQAENLYNKTFKINPDSKVVVLAGIDHILEKPTTSGKEWMASVFKNKYSIDPLTISQTHLNSYRNQLESSYGIIKSSTFNMDRLTSVDYFVLNNKTNVGFDALSKSYPYKNHEENDVQIALFYAREFENNYDYYKKVPYFTTVLKSGEKYDLPLDENQDIYLYTFDENGKQIDRQRITPSSKRHQ